MSKLTKDKLDLYVKKSKVDLIENCYEKFAWKKVEVIENDRYEDLVDITFEREHKIPHKDDLQLMQVYMEHYLNDMGVIESRKHAKSTALGLCLGVLSIGLAGLGLWLILSLATTLAIVMGGVTIAVGVIGAVAVFVATSRIYKQETITSEKNIAELQVKLENICNEAEKLIGDDYEQV